MSPITDDSLTDNLDLEHVDMLMHLESSWLEEWPVIPCQKLNVAHGKRENICLTPGFYVYKKYHCVVIE